MRNPARQLLWAAALSALSCIRASAVGDAAADADTPVRMGTVTATILNVRARPARHFEVLGQVKKGDRLRILEETDEWYRILLQTQTRAWVAARYIAPDSTVTGDRVRVHSGPGLVFTTFAHLSKGTKVTRIGSAVEGWQRIETPPDASAWVSRAYVQADALPEPVDDTDDEAQDGDTQSTGDAGDTVAGTDAAQEDPEGTVATDTTAAVEPDDDADDADTAAVSAPDRSEAGDVVAAVNSATDDSEQTDVTDDSEQTDAMDAAVTDDASDAADVAAGKPDDGEQTVSVAGDEDDGEEDIPDLVYVDAGSDQSEQPDAVQADDDGDSSATSTGPRLVVREGVLFPLRDPIPGVATHFLGLRVNFTCYPVCYLYSDRRLIDLTEWELREVVVHGEQVWYRGWRRPVVNVRSVQILQTD